MVTQQIDQRLDRFEEVLREQGERADGRFTKLEASLQATNDAISRFVVEAGRRFDQHEKSFERIEAKLPKLDTIAEDVACLKVSVQGLPEIARDVVDAKVAIKGIATEIEGLPRWMGLLALVGASTALISIFIGLLAFAK